MRVRAQGEKRRGRMIRRRSLSNPVRSLSAADLAASLRERRSRHTKSRWNHQLRVERSGVGTWPPQWPHIRFATIEKLHYRVDTAAWSHHVSGVLRFVGSAGAGLRCERRAFWGNEAKPPRGNWQNEPNRRKSGERTEPNRRNRQNEPNRGKSGERTEPNRQIGRTNSIGGNRENEPNPIGKSAERIQSGEIGRTNRTQSANRQNEPNRGRPVGWAKAHANTRRPSPQSRTRAPCPCGRRYREAGRRGHGAQARAFAHPTGATSCAA